MRHYRSTNAWWLLTACALVACKDSSGTDAGHGGAAAQGGSSGGPSTDGGAPAGGGATSSGAGNDQGGSDPGEGGGAASTGGSAGDAGGEAEGGAAGEGGGPPLPECTPGEIQCAGAELSTCTEEGSWGAPVLCANGCADSTACMTCGPGTGSCDGDPSNGCETYTGDDEENCGRCGHSCAGGACISHVCQPVALMSPARAFSYVLEPATIYAGGTEEFDCNPHTTCNKQTFHSMPKAGGPRTDIPMGLATQGQVRVLATDANYLYWAHTDTVYWYFGHDTKVRRAPKTGGASTVLHDLEPFDVVTDMKMDGGELFYAYQRSFDGTIVKMGTSPTPLATTLHAVRLVLDATHIYWSERPPAGAGTQLSIRRVPRDGGAVETIVASYASQRDEFTTDLALDEGFLYWIDNAGIHRANKNGSNPTMIMPVTDLAGHTPTFNILVGPTRIFFGSHPTTLFHEGYVRSIWKEGGIPSTDASCSDGARRLQIEAPFLYYTCGSAFPILHRLVPIIL